MVTRSADTQLGHSLPLLLATVGGMALTYLAPPVAIVAGAALGDWPGFGLGVIGTALMAACYLPTTRMYGLHACWSLTLPGAASLYIAMTVDSAIRHRRGVGGRWKGRLFGPTAGQRSETWSPGR
jgi:hypothetical protein